MSFISNLRKRTRAATEDWKKQGVIVGNPRYIVIDETVTPMESYQSYLHSSLTPSLVDSICAGVKSLSPQDRIKIFKYYQTLGKTTSDIEQTHLAGNLTRRLIKYYSSKR